MAHGTQAMWLTGYVATGCMACSHTPTRVFSPWAGLGGLPCMGEVVGRGGGCYDRGGSKLAIQLVVV